MNKQDLAAALRQRQQAAIEWLSDDEIIESHVICPGCGDMHIGGEELEDFIADAEDPEHFFELVTEEPSARFTVGDLLEYVNLYVDQGLPLDTPVTIRLFSDENDAVEEFPGTIAGCNIKDGRFFIIGDAD